MRLNAKEGNVKEKENAKQVKPTTLIRPKVSKLTLYIHLDAPPKVIKNLKELQREKEIEDEIRERKKQEKKTRDKETAYQERLRNWENRER